MNRRLLRWPVLIVLFAVMIGGGAGHPAAAQDSRSRDARPNTREMDDMKADIATAVNVVDRFWAAHWSQFFTGRYYRPNVYGGYSHGGRRAPYCGGERLEYDNAFYCRPGDYIAWDTDLMRDGYRSGDAWVYDIIAHEWGHAIQARLNGLLVARARELQADCLAGAALNGAAADGTLLFEDGDVDEIAAAYRRLADETPWTKPGDHGTARQRISAFERGAYHGVRGCVT